MGLYHDTHKFFLVNLTITFNSLTSDKHLLAFSEGIFTQNPSTVTLRCQ